MSQKLKDRFSTVCRTLHYSLSTERQYWDVCRKFVKSIKAQSEADLLDAADVKAGRFLSQMAVNGAAASTHSVALCALVFLYSNVLKNPLGKLQELERPTRPARLPSVPASHEETMKLLGQVSGRSNLILRLIYGDALRVHDALRIRLHDLDFANDEILIRASKGDKDRIVPMPKAIRAELKALADLREAEHLREKREGNGWVWLPGLMGKKTPSAHFETGWQYLFAAQKESRDPRSGKLGRHHITPEAIQGAMRNACRKMGTRKRFSPHALRHASARTMEKKRVPLASIQAMLGHANVETTLRYLGAGTKIAPGVSPLD